MCGRYDAEKFHLGMSLDFLIRCFSHCVYAPTARLNSRTKSILQMHCLDSTSDNEQSMIPDHCDQHWMKGRNKETKNRNAPNGRTEQSDAVEQKGRHRTEQQANIENLMERAMKHQTFVSSADL